MVSKYSKLFGQLNQETQEHSKRVAELCAHVAERMGADKKLMYIIGYVHDIGKLYIPSRIIKKSERLTTLEREIIDLHSYFGYEMLKEMGESKDIYIPVLYHHGFVKPKINFNYAEEPITPQNMLAINILHSADVFDAMMSKRVYHEPYDKDYVLEELSNDVLSSDAIVEHLDEFDGLYNLEAA